MKKNRLFVLGLVTAFVGLISLSLVSGTWAKYTSSVNAASSARVAKWGFEYNNNGENKSVLVFDLFKTVNDDNVKNGDNENIIAPGTSGKLQLLIKNTSEVSAKVKVELLLTNDGNIPLLFSDNGSNWLSLSEFNKKLEKELKLEGELEFNPYIYWKWQIEGNDTNDTELGIKGTDIVTVTTTVTFTQID